MKAKIIAEDLGVLDEGVYRLMRNVGYPRMKVLEFAFDGNPEHEFKPSNYADDNCVVYTGTHDNATFIEFLQDLDEEAREVFYKDLVSECKKANKRFYYSPSQLADIETMQRAREATIRLSYGSCAKYVILPLQDLLGTGATSRMNTPGTLSDRNWSWRYEEDDLKNTLAAKLARMVKKANR